MALNREDKIKMLGALSLLGLPDKKQEISESVNKVEFSWREKPPIPILANAKEYSDYLDDLDKEGDLDDEELLQKLAEQIFSYVKKYPELMRELKEKYFKDL